VTREQATPMLFALGLACGPSQSDPTSTMGMGATGTVGLDDIGTADDDGASGDSLPCGKEIHEGALVIDNRIADLESVRRYRIVEGSLWVARREEQDLSFLECIEEIHGNLGIAENANLRTTAGLDRLYRLDGALYLEGGHPALETIEGLGMVRELTELELRAYSVRKIDLPHVERIGSLHIAAQCSSDPLNAQPTWDLALTDLDGFPSLAHLDRLYVQGTKNLSSLDGLRAIRDNGGGPINRANVQANGSLPEDHANEVLDYVGTNYRIVCNNLDGEEMEECPCGIVD
jgi:hypothetical protein